MSGPSDISKRRERPAWYGIAPHCRTDAHLSHLVFQLDWAHGWESLAEAIETVRRIAAHEKASICLGGSGPFDLLIHPGIHSEILFSIIPNAGIDPVRNLSELDIEFAERLIPLVGNNGCGPTEAAELIDEFGWALTLAKRLGRPVSISGHAGMYEPLVGPDGTWRLIDAVRPTHRLYRGVEAELEGAAVEDHANVPSGSPIVRLTRDGREMAFTLSRGYSRPGLDRPDFETASTPGYGHPWDGRTGWDLMELRAKSEAARDAGVAAREKEHWLVWISGICRSPIGDGSLDPEWPFGAVLYRPIGACGPWRDPGPAGPSGEP